MKNILKNVNIILTRAKHQAIETIHQLESLGANVISFPTIKITTIKNDPILDEKIKNINNYNSLIFTSENAVKSLLEKLDELGINFDPKRFFIISIGGKTSQVLRENEFRIDFQSKLFTSKSLIEKVSLINLVGRKILVPSSTLSKKNQFSILEKSGAIVEQVAIYTNTVNDTEFLDKELNEIKKKEIDLYIFTSPSTFKGYVEIQKIGNCVDYFKNKNIAVIGPVTKKTLEEFSLKPNIMPNNYTMNNLITEIKKFYSKEKIIQNI